MTAAAAAEARPTDELPLGVPFEARGQIFNQAGNAPAVALQARKSAMIVIRRADGLVFFARQLKAGETLVAPTGRGLSAEVNDPDSFYTFLNNSLVGKVTALHQPLDAIQPPPPPRPASDAPAVGATDAAFFNSNYCHFNYYAMMRDAKDAVIRAKDQAIAAKDQAIAAKDAVANAKTEALAAKDALIAAKDEIIAALRAAAAPR